MSTERKTFLSALVGALLALSVPAALAGEITLYEHRDLRGDSLTLHRGAPNLERTGPIDSARASGESGARSTAQISTTITTAMTVAPPW